MPVRDVLQKLLKKFPEAGEGEWVLMGGGVIFAEGRQLSEYAHHAVNGKARPNFELSMKLVAES